MSYIIAFVQFSVPGEVYPVECLRTDIHMGDEVLVHLPNRQLTSATVVQVCYLSWKCLGQIKGKVSEAIQREDGGWLLNECPTVVGLATNDVFVAELKRRGWVPLTPPGNYMKTLTNSNQHLSANILVRRNGIDLNILATKRNSIPPPYSLCKDSLAEGRTVRHYFAHTTFNLYEGILRFADSFMADEGNYDRFFKSVGERDRRTDKQKQEAEKKRQSRAKQGSNGLKDYYDMVSDGSGAPVYGGDGMWICSEGSLRD